MSIRFSSPRAAVASLLLSTAFLAACGGSSSSSNPAPAPTAASLGTTSGSTYGGTAVTLTGTNLVTGATVTVGGAAATGVAVTGGTSVAFTTPAHAAGAVDVVVTNPDSQSATLAGAYTYVTPTNQVWVVPDGAANLTTGVGSQVEAFQAGGTYLNAHTTAHGTGEIRGQLDVTGDVRLASLDRVQEGLSADATKFGAGILQIDPATRAARGFVIASGLTAINAAHVHQAARGSGGTPVITLVTKGDVQDVWVVPDGTVVSQAVADAFQAGTLYYNVHTAANPNGEIRGQLDKVGTLRYASLDAAQEAGITSTALGAGLVAVDQANLKVAGFAVTTAFTSAVNNAHLHGPAARGAPAGASIPMRFGPTLVVVPDDAAALTAQQATDILGGLYYVNVHTVANGTGEIRGQLDKRGDLRVTTLDGAQEVPVVSTNAFGGGLAAVDGSTGQVSGFMVTRGLVSPTIAHIHRQNRGTGGGTITDMAK